MRKACLLFSLIFCIISISSEDKQSLLNYMSPDGKSKTDHYLVKWKAWQSLSIFGILGTFSNVFLLFMFYSERAHRATAVNAMMFLESSYRVGHSLVLHWRNYNMVHNHTLFHGWLDTEQVKN